MATEYTQFYTTSEVAKITTLEGVIAKAHKSYGDAIIATQNAFSVWQQNVQSIWNGGRLPFPDCWKDPYNGDVEQCAQKRYFATQFNKLNSARVDEGVKKRAWEAAITELEKYNTSLEIKYQTAVLNQNASAAQIATAQAQAAAIDFFKKYGIVIAIIIIIIIIIYFKVKK